MNGRRALAFRLQLLRRRAPISPQPYHEYRITPHQAYGAIADGVIYTPEKAILGTVYHRGTHQAVRPLIALGDYVDAPDDWPRHIKEDLGIN